uniref:DLp/HDL-BGBP n=1 Tax=Astacus leptodactylus TaxID=6717 RepID=W8EAE4_ASTLP|nr:dLp/HDL-BGBP precursor [Astacus leptodactylus]
MRTALILAVVTASALAGPTGQRTSCALHCSDTNLYLYQPGKSYVYDYSVTTSTALLGTLEDDAHLHITARVHIDVSAPCEYTLRVTDVTLGGSAHEQEFAAAITKSPLRFAFQDGRVETLCSHVSEPAWVLNFKRGVLSTFHNSFTSKGTQEVQETDISGVCTTSYQSVSEGDVVSIEKTKDLTSCKGRPSLSSYIASSGYISDSPVQSLPVFKSTSTCNQVIEEGVLKLAKCEESHKFRPFSSEEGGAVTTATTTMMLVSQDSPALPRADYQFNSKSLVFDQIISSDAKTQIDTIEKILSELEEGTQDEVLPEVPALFSTLVASLKSLDYPALNTVYTNTKQANARKFLVDAMPLVGTAAAIGVVRDMFINGDMTDADADVWFTSLAFFKNPTSEMFTALAPLLQYNPSQQAMLGSSALVNTYCKIHPDCGDDSGIQQVLRYLESHLGSGCRSVNDEEKMKILVALKALGNTGHWVNASPVLRQCYTEENDMEVRVAAIEAWRHTPCDYDRSNLLAAFQDETQDTEVRIAAYLAVMTCPTPTIINTIKDRLISEGVNQVGSFIWTHMANLQESATPDKQWLRELIGEELLQKKFSTEALKFSRNYESSFFMNELNAGAAVESNVIFSSKSYLPRSAMLNLTLDLFGESINLFEIGGRIEGFEAYIERFFGPSGYFPEETVAGILKNMRQKKPDADATTLEGFLDKVTDEPEGSYYLRVFGNELQYKHFHGLENLMKASGSSNPLEMLMELARTGDVDYTKSYQLINTHYTIPTISGLPLTLTAKGIATLALRMNGNFKAQSLQNINIEGHLQPSAAVQMDGMMLVDAHVTRTGLKISSTLHTSTFLDGKVQIDGGKLVDIAFNTPKDKVEVIDVSTKFFYLEDDREIRKEGKDEVKYEGCRTIISGLEMCGELSYTSTSAKSPGFPLSGPAALHLYMRKTDTQTGYNFRFTSGSKEITFLFDTPESQANHKVALNIAKTGKNVNFELEMPCISLQGTCEYIWRKNNKYIKLDLTSDNTEKYTLETGLQITGKDVKKFESSLIIISPRGEILNAKGTLEIDVANTKYVADVRVSGRALSPLSLRASYEGIENTCNVEVALDTPVLDINAKGQFVSEGNFVTSRADIEYSTLSGDKQTIHHSALIKTETSEDVNTYTLKFELTPSEFADMALDIDIRSIISTGRLENIGTITRGPATWNIKEIYSYNHDENNFNFNVQIEVLCPYHNIDYLALEELKMGRNYLNAKSQIRIRPGEEGTFTLDLSHNNDIDIEGRIMAQIPGAKATIEVLVNEVANGHYKAKVTGNINDIETDTVSLEGSVQDNSHAGKFNVLMDGSFKCPGHTSTFSSGIFADSEKANVDLNTDINGRKYTMKIEGTRTSILVDANICRHVLLDAHITSADEGHKLLVSIDWNKNVDPTQSLVISGQLSPTEVKAGFRFGEQEVSASCRRVDNGLEMEASWAPHQSVLASLHYSLGDTKSLVTTIITPFQGWEKQELTFNVTLKDHEISSRVSATWKNAEQMALTINGKLRPGTFTNALSAKILFSSSFESLERITFTLDHAMDEATINTNIAGQWNKNEMRGSFQLTPSDSGVDARATFMSPVTEEVLITLHHELLNSALSTKLEAKYGEQTYAIILKGEVNLSEVQVITLVLKTVTSLSSVPQFSVNVKYTLSDSNINLVIEGKAGEKKILLNMNVEKTVTERTTAIAGDLRFITPFTYPLTATLSHSHDGQQFTSQFEISRIWSNFGSVKMHAEGHMANKSDIEMTALLSSPATKASFSFNHKVTDKKMDSIIDVAVNGERMTAWVKGILDVSQSLANLQAQVSSTINGLNDIKINIESLKEANTRTSKILFSKGINSLNIAHIITFIDLLNWENSFDINGIYKISNSQSHTGTVYTHQLDYAWVDGGVLLTASIDPKISAESRKIDAKVTLTSSWEYYENVKIDLHYEDDGIEYKPTLRIEYKPGSVIEIATTTKFDIYSFYTEATLTSPFWQPLGCKFNLDFKTRTPVTLVLTRGANKTTINASGNWEKGKFDGQIDIKSTYLEMPISFEASYDVLSPEKRVRVAVTTDHKYEVTGAFSGHMKNAKWSLVTELPIQGASVLEFSGEYQVTALPFTMNAMLKVESSVYAVKSKISMNEFMINMDVNGQKGSLESKWFYQYTHANMEIKFQSPLNTLDMAAYIMYDFETQKKIHVKLTHGNQEINLIGKLEGGTVVFEGTTPIRGWEALNASFFTSKSAINAFISRNDRRIEMNGTMHIRHGMGKIELTITTPYANYKSITAKTDYNFHSETKMVEFKSTFGTRELSIKGNIRVSDPFTPEMKLAIITPFEAVKTIGGEAQWNMKDSVKTAKVKVYHNDIEYKWQVEATAESMLKGYAAATITTPLPGWTHVSVKGSFDFTTMPYTVVYTHDKEGVVNTFEGKLAVAQNAITGDVTTPITGWEKVELKGSYNINNNRLAGNLEFDKGSEKYEVNGDIMFNSQTPKLNINIKTPIHDTSNIQLTLDANMVDTEKTFRLTFLRNDITYSAEFTGQLIYKTGFFKVITRSPITGYSDLEIYGNYDFTGDIKTIEMNLKKENKKQHFFMAVTVNDNKFNIDVVTPFESFEVVKMNGDYTTTMRGEHNLVASFVKNSQTYSFQVAARIDTTSVALRLSTPIPVINNVVLNGKYELLSDGVEGSVHFERNDDMFEFNTHASFTPLKSNLFVAVDTPVSGWNKIIMVINYDIISDKKFAEISIKNDNFAKIFRIDASYSLESGSLKIKTPFEGFEALGGEYTLSVNKTNRKMEASIKIHHNSEEWILSAYGQYDPDSFIIKFHTPFEELDTVAVEGNINVDTKTIKGVIKLGSINFSINVSYAMDNMFFELVTPFEALKFVSASASYKWISNQKETTLTIVYNEKKYILNGALRLSPQASSISLQATTPILGFDTMSFQIKYDINNRDELLSAHVTLGEDTYNFVTSAYIEDKIAYFKCSLMSPLPEWTNAKFEVKVDFSQDDKLLEISLEKDGNVKAIAISGKLIGSTMDFSLKTPFTGLKNLNMFGSLNRAKRSLEFKMMNDAGEASLVTNFNSAKLHLKTPFARAEEVTWEITKVNDNSYKAEWKRNNNYVMASIEKEGRSRAFSLEIKSELQGWEFLALTGKLDQDALQGYVSGAINEEKVTLSIQGRHDVEGEFTLNMTTPYDNYRTVEGKLAYSLRKRQMKLEASSSSSEFHYIFKYTRRNGVESHLLVPNEQQNTELTVNLGPLAGKIVFTSRFEALRNFHHEYKVTFEQHTGLVMFSNKITINDIDVFSTEFEGNSAEKKLHLEVHTRLPGRHSVFHVHREGFSIFNLNFKRQIEVSGDVVEKEFKVELSGSGDLPEEGTINAIITNTFREQPRTITAKIDVNRLTSPKTIRIEVNPTPSGLYIFDITYNIDLTQPSHGDYDIRITTPDRSAAPWKHISGSWDVQDTDTAQLTFNIGDVTYTANGKLGIRESTMILSADGSENIFLQWKFEREGTYRDYYLKLGRESRYGMLKLKGTITDIAHVDIEGGFKVGPFQPEEFLFTSKWNKGPDGSVTGEGSFNYGDYHGSHTLEEFHWDAAQRSATFRWTSTSNFPDYEQISVSGNYDVYGKFVFNAKIKVNERESKIDINISNLNPKRSSNTLEWDVPILGEFGKVQLTLSHNFRKATSKSIAAVAKIGRRQAFVKANWNRSENFETLDGTIEVKSKYLGDINISIKYDVTNIQDANAEVKYSRKAADQQEKYANIKWHRKSSAEHLEGEIIIDTSLEHLSHARVYNKADFSDIFHLRSGLEWNDKAISLDFNVGKNSLSGKITTPFENFETIEGELTYSMESKDKVVTLKYERGERKVNMNLTLNRKSKKRGDFELSLTTPFDVMRNVNIKGSWNKGQAQVNYERNDVKYSFEGQADVQGDKSDFDITFRGPGGESIRIAAAYDVENFLAGRGTEPKNLASLKLEFETFKISYNMQGYRNSDRIYIEADGESTLLTLKKLHLKLDSELSTEARDGSFEITVNDFEFKIDNHFERHENQDYYFKSKIESTLTPLPALVFGIGRKDEERIITLGYGEGQEITFSIKGKNNFRSGFSGSADIPNYGYEGVKFDVDYGFESDDELVVKIEIELGEDDQEVEAHFTYNSEGVKARLSSPYTGDHSLRARRSIASDSFFTELGLDDYNVKLRGGLLGDGTKRGAMLEGDIFGNKFLIDSLFQSEGQQYSEGKLVIQTPFRCMEKMGGLFTLSNVNTNIMAHAEVFLPSCSTPKLTGKFNLNLNDKIDGYVTVDVAGEQFTLKSNLVGASLSQGYQGTLEIYTPFHALSSVVINGKIKMEGLSLLEADLKVVEPSVHVLQVKYQLSPETLTASLNLNSIKSEDGIKINFILEGFGSAHKKMELNLCNDKLVAEYTISESTFKFTLDSLIIGVPRQLSLEAKYLSLEAMEGSFVTALAGQTHNIHGEFSVVNNRIQGGIELESTLIEGTRKLNFDISIPDASFKQVFFDVTFVTSETYSMYLELDATTGILATLKIDAPIFRKVTVNFECVAATASLVVDTPAGIHKAKVTWRITRKTPADWLATAELVSPLLKETYTFSGILSGNREQRMIKAELDIGEVRHAVEASTSMAANGGGFLLIIETPFKNINKATLQTSLQFGNKIQLEVAANLSEQINTFNFTFDNDNQTLVTEAKSSYIPTGLVRAEAAFTGNMKTNMQLKAALMNSDKNISGVLNLKIPSSKAIKVNLKVATPFKGYRKMNFVAQYMKNEVTNIILSIDKPVSFSVNAQFANINSVIKSNLKIETSVETLENIEAELYIPLEKFAPRAVLTLANRKYGIAADFQSGIESKMSANLYLNEACYAGNLALRTKAPYELAYGFHLADKLSRKFHLRTDSSFISAFV